MQTATLLAYLDKLYTGRKALTRAEGAGAEGEPFNVPMPLPQSVWRVDRGKIFLDGDEAMAAFDASLNRPGDHSDCRFVMFSLNQDGRTYNTAIIAEHLEAVRWREMCEAT